MEEAGRNQLKLLFKKITVPVENDQSRRLEKAKNYHDNSAED